ncbi:MAG: SOS response-associated peptidase, partial [Frankiaceae bacterium]|nr:SOS response-associated peptidase [Frankiaceae bacterium]
RRMCGRYANSRHDGDLLREFQVASVVDPEPDPSWNVAPTDGARVVLERVVNDEPDRQLRTLRWGLVPSWAKDVKIGARLINARSETVLEKPAFKAAASRRRCLVPADGYYEWMKTTDRKVPMYLHGDGILAFAGLYEIWRDPNDDDGWVRSFTVITRPAQDALGHVHDRCPVVVPPDLRDPWLDPSVTEPDAVGDLLAAIPDPSLQTYEVAPLVNSVKNDGPELIKPV